MYSLRTYAAQRRPQGGPPAAATPGTARLLLPLLSVASGFGLGLGPAARRAAAQEAPPAAARAAAQEDPSLLTLERIFASAALFPKRFGPARWLEDGSAYTTLEPAAGGKPGTDIVRYDVKTGQRTVLVPAAWLVSAEADGPLKVERYEWSPDGRRLLIFTNSRRVWRRNTRGDFWVLDLSSHALLKLGGPEAAPSTLMFAKFSPDGTRVGYVREHDLYVEDLSDGRITRLTSDGSDTIVNGTSDWVYEEELDVRDGFRWSPDGKRIAYWQFDMSGVRDFLLIDDTDSLYSFTIPVQYPKVGTTNSAVRAGVVRAAGGPTTWLDVPGDPRNHYIARLEWAASSDEVVLQQLNRLQNTDLVMLADVHTGAVRTVLTERDSAWVDVVNDLEWLGGGRSFTWVSERDGWRHVYLVSRDGRKVRRITRGAFDVASVEKVDEPHGWLYYIASPDNATQRYLYRTRLTGNGKPQRLSPADAPGTHSYDIAPDAHHAFHTYSTFDTPPVVELVTLPHHHVLRTLEDNAKLRERVAALRRGPYEFFQVDVGGGPEAGGAVRTDAGAGSHAGASATLDAWMIKPPDFDPSKKYPVLFYVYGEPAGVTVTDRWSAFTGLWFLMLAQQGYIVASVDNRGTPSLKGRAWRKSVYREIGVLASADQAAAARAIARRPYVDSTRIGVWGWSGGGSMTLNLLFRSPELYEVGMSVAPVPDQHLYDTIYQERYMGLPADNEAGYRAGSPITFADRLRGKLLLVHGSGDDNVHYQGTERLVNALVAANKPFTLMVYPNRTHCICEGRGTYLHLFGLLTRFLHENLPAGGIPQQMGS